VLLEREVSFRFHELITKGVEPKPKDFNNLLQKVKTVENELSVFGMIQAAEVESFTSICSSLLKKAGTFESGLNVLEMTQTAWHG
jgi:predicted SprT family Zn-dependent metalloprotease